MTNGVVPFPEEDRFSQSAKFINCLCEMEFKQGINRVISLVILNVDGWHNFC